MRYIPGRFLHIADTLSGIYSQSCVSKDNDMHQDMIELREINCNDPIMKRLHQCTKEGWPEHKSDVPPPLQSFGSVRNHVHAVDGILLKDKRVVILLAWRKDTPEIVP